MMGYEVILEELLDTTKLEKKVATIQNEMEIVEELLRKMVDENSRKAMDQKEYLKKYNELVERYKKAQDTILADFDEALWTSTIDKVVIENDITFYFRDGSKIKQEIL